MVYRFDPASLKILDHLNAVAADLKTLLARGSCDEPRKQSKAASSASQSHLLPKTPMNLFTLPPSEAPTESAVSNSMISVSPSNTAASESSDSFIDTLGFPTDELYDEKILKWPIFELPYTITPLIESLLDAEANSSLEVYDYANNQAIPTTELWELVDSFLLNVHIKNPILDFQRLRKSAANIIQHGFKWDDESCLMLHVCALGAVSSPYSALLPDDLMIDPLSSSIADSYADIQHSKMYYCEASKRLSIVRKFSLVQIQCYVLSGIYLMFTMQPLVAWRQFHLACVSCQIYFKRQNRDSKWSDIDRSLEQRLLWTALKSEW